MRDANNFYVVVAAVAMACMSCAAGCEASSNDESYSNISAIEIQKTTTAQDPGDQGIREREATDAGRLLNKTAQDKDEPAASSKRSDRAGPDAVDQPEKQTIKIPKSWTRLGKQEEIWIDKDAKEVIIAGHVCLNNGPLEMFICPQRTKEHESIISANASALQVHLALVALGADPGKATSWDPEYRAAYGPTIKVTLKWHDDETNATKTADANQWIRDMKTGKPLQHPWVFGGSQFWEDPDSNEKIYYGDSGELICLSNFSTATIDLSVESSQSNDGLLFEAFTENIPPLGTKVYAIIKPGKRIEPKSKTKDPAADPTANDSAEGTSDSGDEDDQSNSH